MTAAMEEIVAMPGGALWTCSSGSGVPLLLCHGGPGGYDQLAPVAALVEHIARVHRFDQRGGGRSTLSGPWTIDALIADIEGLRRHWGHERWLVGGHSWGAHLALFYALEHPERVSGLVLLNGTGIRWGWGVERRARRLPRLTTAERAEVEELESELAGGADESAITRLRDLWWLIDFADRANALRTPRFADYPANPRVVAALEQDWERRLSGIGEQLNDLTMPALILHGEADPIGAAGPRELAQLLPGGRFVSLPGVGHLPWLEDPTELRLELRAFVERLS